MSDYSGKSPIIKTLKRIIIFIVLVIVCVIGFQFIVEKMYPIEYSDYVDKYSKEYGVSEELVYAVIKTESNFDSSAISSVDAKGLMQIKKETFEWLQQKMGVEGYSYTYDNIFEPDTNVKFGTYLLSILITEYDGDEATALCAYYAGRDTVSEWLKTVSSSDHKKLDSIPSTSVETYVNKVLRNKNIYEKRLSK